MKDVYKMFLESKSLVKITLIKNTHQKESYVVGFITSLESDALVIQNDRSELKSVIFYKDIKRVSELKKGVDLK